MYLVYVDRTTGAIECSSGYTPDETPLSVFHSIYETVGQPATFAEVPRESSLATHDAFQEERVGDRLSPEAIYLASFQVIPKDRP